LYRCVLALDFDRALSANRTVPVALQTALERLRSAGYALFLVTGRRFGDAALVPVEKLFAGMVWENGAVLYHPTTDSIYLPFGRINPRLVEALAAAGVPLEYGRAIVSTRKPHDETVSRVLSNWVGHAVVTQDGDISRILPPGTAKGAGLERLLALCGFSPRNLVSLGDGEGDPSLLQLAETGVTVADALGALQEVADLVADRPGATGAVETVEAFWLGKGSERALRVRQRRHVIPLGRDDAGTSVSIPANVLARGNLGVFGDSGTGKSWVAGLLAEGMHHAGYQVLMIDPEGDFRGMQALPGVVAITVAEGAVPPPRMIATVLDAVTVSVVLDLTAYPPERRDAYVAELLPAVDRLRAARYRPHWVVLEEAQQFLPPNDNALWNALQPMLVAGGWAFVSYRPDRLPDALLATLDMCIVTQLCEPDAVEALGRTSGCNVEASVADIPSGHAWLCGERVVCLRPNARRIPHIRHLYKYMDTPLPKHKRFYFRDHQHYLQVEAASLFEFLQCLRTVPVASLSYHQARGDFARWVADALGDGVLADQLLKLARRPLAVEALREALLRRVSAHCQELRELCSQPSYDAE